MVWRCNLGSSLGVRDCAGSKGSGVTCGGWQLDDGFHNRLGSTQRRVQQQSSTSRGRQCLLVGVEIRSGGRDAVSLL